MVPAGGFNPQNPKLLPWALVFIGRVPGEFGCGSSRTSPSTPC